MQILKRHMSVVFFDLYLLEYYFYAVNIMYLGTNNTGDVCFLMYDIGVDDVDVSSGCGC